MSSFQMVLFLNGGLKTEQTMSVLWLKMPGIQMVFLIMLSDHLDTGQKLI